MNQSASTSMNNGQQSVNTSAQIQQIFADVQLQLPSVNFDTDDVNDESEVNEVNHD
jgi:hypothetical protein